MLVTMVLMALSNTLSVGACDSESRRTFVRRGPRWLVRVLAEKNLRHCGGRFAIRLTIQPHRGDDEPAIPTRPSRAGTRLCPLTPACVRPDPGRLAAVV